MIFASHSSIKGMHALIGASRYSWLNYGENELINFYENQKAKERGIKLHDFACKCIELRQKLPRSNKTLNMYVNDAISLKMTPEQVLYYSENVFGTCDAISFDKDELHIHDLKTGVQPAHMEQLQIYAALFFLEYNINPNDILTELRIYQSDEVGVCNPIPEDIIAIMDKIIEFDKIIKDLKSREE